MTVEAVSNNSSPWITPGSRACSAVIVLAQVVRPNPAPHLRPAAGKLPVTIAHRVAGAGELAVRPRRACRLEPLLVELASCTEATAYLAAQDRAAVAAESRYDELVDAAYDAAAPRHRCEALHLIAHLGRDGCRTVLQDSRQADPDPTVRACAEALLFRVIVRDRVRASGELDEAACAAYLHSVRQQSAQQWVARQAEPDAGADPARPSAS